MEIPAAIGFIMCARVGGIAIALAMANTIFLNIAEKSISNLLPNVPSSEVQGAISGVGSSLLAALDEDMKIQVLQAIINALRKGFILGITAGCLSVVLAVFMNRTKIVLQPPGANREKGGAKA